jgi:hypothetical protein
MRQNDDPHLTNHSPYQVNDHIADALDPGEAPTHNLEVLALRELKRFLCVRCEIPASKGQRQRRHARDPKALDGSI